MSNHTKPERWVNPNPPPLGDLTTRQLARLVLASRGGFPVAGLHKRGASLGDARAEIIRRETLGVGVQG